MVEYWVLSAGAASAICAELFVICVVLLCKAFIHTVLTASMPNRLQMQA